MWSQITLCLLVGFAYASQNPGWNDNSEYVYQVRGRTVASLNQVSDDYSGIVLKAKLHVIPRPDGNLDAKFSNPQYAQIHSKFYDGWDSEIPDSELSYKQLDISSKPFQIEMNEGAARNIIVDGDITNWEANIIKSIVSQLQLDTKGTNGIRSHYNLRTQDDLDSAVFKTMEETVTGVSQTLYEIRPLPEYVLQSTPWLVPLKDEMQDDDKVIEVMKTKNYTHSPITYLPSYHFGLQGIPGYEPDNQIADVASRTSLTRAVITGNLNDYTIQSVVTVDQIVLRPTMLDKEMGSVNTMVNVSLEIINKQASSWDPPSNPVKTGLVYRYNDPFGTSNKVRSGIEIDHNNDPGSEEAEDYNRQESPARRRLARDQEGFSSRRFAYSEQEQPQPKLNEPPQSPMLPFTVGYDGQSYNKKHNIVETTRKLAQQIGQELQHPEEMPAKNTVGKFMILTSLLRLMNENEMQQVSGYLYTQETEGIQAAAWHTYRSAVAQAGTGPSFMTIRDWIQKQKISDDEAADAVANTVYSARAPTEEYMREFFFTIIQNEQIMAKPYLNESALLSYSHLVHQVYVHKNVSHSKYPVHSFGPFYTDKGLKFVKEKVIPHLTQKLQEAIAKADTQKIHVYIRALGNVGHQRILEAFEPYLEGKQHVSQYQRILMVVALDRLTRSNPRVARSVLYKIYQNPSEHEQVRAAAVFQLMRTNPPPSMLQRMASYTNVDSNHYVNSAVKSAIEQAAQLQGSQHAKLRSAAHSAKHLFSNPSYGQQYNHQHMKHYVVEQMKLAYHQQVDIFSNPDSFINNGIKYSLQGQFGGFERELMDKQAIVSSIDDLYDVFQQQTEEYKNQQKQKDQQPKHPWSSENIAELLGMKNEERERLEGNFYVFEETLQKIWSFDNETIERLPYVLQQREEELKMGKSFNYSRLMVNQETALAFPTVLGLPFIYTYDIPTYIRFEGKIKATSQPPVSTGNVLRKPDHVDVEYEVRTIIYRKVQTQYGFFTPFDNHRYSAGYDKNFQFILPFSGKIQLDTQKQQFYMEYQNADGEKDIPLLHMSSWPYTVDYDIYTLEPQKNIIQSQYPHKVNQIIGQKSMGLAVELQMKSDKRIDLASVFEKLYHHDHLSAILAPWPSDEIQYAEVDLNINFQKSTTRKIVAEIGYKSKYQPAQSSNDVKEQNRCSQELPDDYEKRQEESLRRVSAGIKSASAHVVDASVTFQSPQSQIKYIATVATAKSDVDPNGGFLGYFKQDNKQEQPLKLCVDADTKFPNTNGLNLDYAMDMDPTSTVQVRASLSGFSQKPSNVVAKAKFSKSEERKQYFKEQPVYKECKRQMQQGNNQLPICAKATARANLLDQFQINIVSDYVEPRIVNYTYKIYSVLRHHMYPRFQENINIDESHQNQNIDVQGQFSVDLHSVGLFINSPYGKVEVKDVYLHEWARHLLVPHPVFHTKARLLAYAYQYDTYRPICVIDKTAASTFDNKTYSLKNLGDDWTVLLQYVPRRPLQRGPHNPVPNPLPEQLKKQIESYIVLVRNHEQVSGQKELKMIVQSPGTEQKPVEIDLKPKGSSQLPKLYVNQKEMRYNDQEATDIYQGYIKVYALPNYEVKLEVQDAYYVIYDGERAKLTTVNSKFRAASRGICGTFTGEEETDFLCSQFCIWHSADKVIPSYTVPTSNGQPGPVTPEPHDQCFRKQVQYVNVISAQDKGVMGGYSDLSNSELMAGEDQPTHKYSGSACTKVQTQYAVKGDEICFTLRPLPVCKNTCRQQGSVTKKVSVHCVQQTNASNLWRKEIDKGASPDFSQKSETRTIKMEVPQRCLP